MDPGRSTVIYHRNAVAPCVEACPVHIDIPRYCYYIAQGRFDEALAVIREKNPFPAVCGSVCFALCESKCRLNDVGGAMAIRALKRFVAERDTGWWQKGLASREATGKKVSIIGAGPCGLTAGYYLARLGHRVTVFEALPWPGGMLRFGIPEYRLPLSVLEREISIIVEAGVEIRAYTKVTSIKDLFTQGCDAVLVATGCHRDKKMKVQGEEFQGVIGGVEFLRRIRLGVKPVLGERVAVIGGGNVAIDCARSALRVGFSEVHVIYRRSIEEMLAHRSEVEAASQEGVHFCYLSIPTKILGVNGKVKAIECCRVTLGDPDESGRRRPIPIRGSEFTVEVDTVLTAIGGEAELPYLDGGEGARITQSKTVAADQKSMVTSNPGVFVAGDVVTGPASVIEAIAAGRKAAMAIDNYLGGNGSIDEQLLSVEAREETGMPWVGTGQRVQPATIPVQEGIRNFAQVELGFSEEVAVKQAARCLRCDLPIVVNSDACCGCLTCELRCSFRHEKAFSPAAAKIEVQRVSGETVAFKVSFADRCDNCGICVRYCPYGALNRKLESR